MPKFSKISADKLATCDKRLQDIMNEVIKYFDCTITCGHRPKEEQDEAVRLGNSKLKFPNSKHNSFPSKAVDIMPYPINWKDTSKIYLFAGAVLAIAAQKGIALRWGGDWDGDMDLRDNKFNDLPHFELKD